mgnify:CR=1 FL=1
MDINKKILKVLKKTFKGSNFKKNIKQIKLEKIKDWDSLKHFHLLLEVEKEFNLKFTSQVFTKIKSMKDILSEIEKNEKRKKKHSKNIKRS